MLWASSFGPSQLQLHSQLDKCCPLFQLLPKAKEHGHCWSNSWLYMTIIMKICKSPTHSSKCWTNLTHIMHMEMESVTHNLTKANSWRTHQHVPLHAGGHSTVGSVPLFGLGQWSRLVFSLVWPVRGLTQHDLLLSSIDRKWRSPCSVLDCSVLYWHECPSVVCSLWELTCMHWVSGAVNVHGFVRKFFLCAVYTFSFIHVGMIVMEVHAKAWAQCFDWSRSRRWWWWRTSVRWNPWTMGRSASPTWPRLSTRLQMMALVSSTSRQR